MFTPTMVIGHPLLGGKLWPGRTAWWLSSRRESSWSREGGGQVLLPMTSPGHEMEDIILDNAWSKRRFLTYHLNKLYITDLGLDWGHFGSYLSRGKYLTLSIIKLKLLFRCLVSQCLEKATYLSQPVSGHGGAHGGGRQLEPQAVSIHRKETFCVKSNWIPGEQKTKWGVDGHLETSSGCAHLVGMGEIVLVEIVWEDDHY